jgi:SAM-dependent methyltransferase
MDIRDHNRRAWDRQVDEGNEWTVPASAEAIAAARRGEWQVVLTPTRPVPHDWFGRLMGSRVLCLASGGGQQGPILAAAGARVVVFDNSPRQLEQDRRVATLEQLDLTTVEGDMRDLAAFGDGAFDLVFHPCANLFIPTSVPCGASRSASCGQAAACWPFRQSAAVHLRLGTLRAGRTRRPPRRAVFGPDQPGGR